jgi:hypothetical protein
VKKRREVGISEVKKNYLNGLCNSEDEFACKIVVLRILYKQEC